MALSLSDAELDQVSAQLFLFQDPNPLRLSKPSSAGADLASRMTPVAADARFKDLSFGVVDFTANLMAPDIWLHDEELPWQMASTGKIALLLAAVQLRADVRRVKGTGLVSAAADFDEAFATIWNRSSVTWIKQIANARGAPRISTIFDLSLTPIDFAGADTPHDRAKLSAPALHQKWAKEPDLTFWERMWQVGTQSDNVAACTLGSEIGLAFVKAVQRGYGLYDPPGMRMLLGAAYGSPPKKTPVTRVAGAPEYRPVINTESHPVTNPVDATKPIWSTQGSSVTALLAYMIALMQNKLVSSVAAEAQAACVVIRECLADEKQDTMTSLIYEGVDEVATVTKAHTKLGILGRLRCEFAYIEASGKKYGVAAMGIVPVKVGTTRFDEEQRGKDLGKAIHEALTA
jgi:hypothetical protein